MVTAMLDFLDETTSRRTYIGKSVKPGGHVFEFHTKGPSTKCYFRELSSHEKILTE